MKIVECPMYFKSVHGNMEADEELMFYFTPYVQINSEHKSFLKRASVSSKKIVSTL